jgi:hypothetical protein
VVGEREKMDDEDGWNAVVWRGRWSEADLGGRSGSLAGKIAAK